MDGFAVSQDLRDYFQFPTNMRVRGWRERLLQERCIVLLKQALAVYIVQHPDAAGFFRHGQHEFVLGERKPHRRYPSWNHQSRPFNFQHLKRLPNRLSPVRIEVDPPDIKETAAPTEKVNGPAISGDQRGLSSQCLPSVMRVHRPPDAGTV